MKKIAVVTALVAVVALGLSVRPASAWHHGHPHHHGHHHGGHFWGGFGAGAAAGLIFGTLAAPRYEPAPVVVYPPQPVCRDIYTEGYWRQVPVPGDGGSMTYRSEWVPASTQRVCQ